MKRCLASVLAVCLLSVSLVGCGQKATATKETTVSTPGGTTTVTEEKTVKMTGEDPPAAETP